MKTENKWQVHETNSMFQLINPEKEVVAEYFYLNGTLREQDKLQVQYHEIAAKLNSYDELVEVLYKLINVAEQTTKDLVGFDGAPALDNAIDNARAALIEAEINEKPASRFRI